MRVTAIIHGRDAVYAEFDTGMRLTVAKGADKAGKVRVRRQGRRAGDFETVIIDGADGALGIGCLKLPCAETVAVWREREDDDGAVHAYRLDVARAGGHWERTTFADVRLAELAKEMALADRALADAELWSLDARGDRKELLWSMADDRPVH